MICMLEWAIPIQTRRKWSYITSNIIQHLTHFSVELVHSRESLNTAVLQTCVNQSDFNLLLDRMGNTISWSNTIDFPAFSKDLFFKEKELSIHN